jgi:hypothetical protein
LLPPNVVQSLSNSKIVLSLLDIQVFYQFFYRKAEAALYLENLNLR